jgi:protocatechuate 3,4-dioxygenase beta subunit
MHDDDREVGRVLSRREAMQLLGIAAGAFAYGQPALLALGQAAMPGCVVRPEQTEGPYFVDQQLNRSDIRAEPTTGVTKPGESLSIALAVMSVSGGQCQPLPGATVDVWQCDAQGVYSGVSDPGFETAGQKFLRGLQTTDAQGAVRFITIFPGWYRGRTIHIHFKIRTQAAVGGAYEFTSQWYFDEPLNSKILAMPAYARSGQRDTFNSNDGIFRQGGHQLVLAPNPGSNGYAAAFSIGLDLSDSAVGRADGMGRSGGRGPGAPGRFGGPRRGGPPPGGGRG